MLRKLILGLACSLAFSSPSVGQSLEQSYAKLCSGKDKTSETCSALRKALKEKLAADEATAAPGGAEPLRKTPSVVSEAVPAAPRDSLANYLAARELLEKGEARSAAQAFLDNYRTDPKGARAPHSLYYLGQSLVQLKQPAQACKAYAELRRVYAPQPPVELIDVLPPAETSAGCQSGSTQQVARKKEWGGLDRLVGKTFKQRKSMFIGGLNYSTTWRWRTPGEALISDYNIEGSTGSIEYTIDPKTGVVAGYTLEADGTLATVPVQVEGKPTRTTIKVLGPGSYETRVQRFNGSSWSTMTMGREIFESSAAVAERQSEGGGFLGALQGAVAGIQGVASGGGDLSDGLAAAAAGGVAGAAGVDAGTIQSATGILASGSASDPGLGGLASSLGGGGGGGNARPPVGMPGCDAVGVNSGNYRSAALSGGNDVQLKTMCGQAFEYYAAYKRALDQGYSEADANRTYDAHEKSALVANDFYANNRAN